MKKTLLPFVTLFAILFTYSCTDDTGTVNVTYQEATAIYGDLAAVRARPLNTPTQEILNPGKIYIGADFILIGEEGQGIHVIKNANTASPVSANFIQIPGNREFFVSDKILYAESFYDMLKIDLTDLEQVQLIARAENAIQDPISDDQGQTLIGFDYTEKTSTVNEDSDLYNEIIDGQLVFKDYARNIIPKSAVPSSFSGNSNAQSGTVNRINKAFGHIYVVSSQNMIVLEDDNFDSSFEKFTQVGEGMETVFPYEDKLFIGSRASMNIFDISTPSAPYEVYEFDHATSCDPVLAHEEVAYITLRTADFSACPGNTNALVVLDISDLSNPKEKDEVQMQSPYGMAVINDKLYVGEGENGLKIFDLTDPHKPTLTKEISDVEAYDVIAHPTNINAVLIAGPQGLGQYDIATDLSLELTSTISF